MSSAQTGNVSFSLTGAVSGWRLIVTSVKGGNTCITNKRRESVLAYTCIILLS